MKKWLFIVPILIALVYIPAAIVNHINGGNRAMPVEREAQLDPETVEVERNVGVESVAYTVVDREDASLPNRRRISISIVAPEALTFEQRAQTAMKAAQDFQVSDNAHVSTVFLVPSPKLVGMGLNLAIARYAPDGGGYSGDQGWRWEVQATDQPLDEQRLRITELWEEKQSSFLIPDGFGGMRPDEDAIDQAVATELGINLDEVRTLLFFLDDYTSF